MKVNRVHRAMTKNMGSSYIITASQTFDYENWSWNLNWFGSEFTKLWETIWANFLSLLSFGGMKAMRGAKSALARHVCVGDKENKNILNVVKVKHVNTELLRATSHYGQRSRGRQIAPFKLQESKNSASWHFTLEVKVQRLTLFKMPTWQYFLTKATNSRRKFGSDMNENANYGERLLIFLIKKNQNWQDLRRHIGGVILDKGLSEMLPLPLDFGLDLWRLHTIPGQRLQFLR
jgi:hypothetical protein